MAARRGTARAGSLTESRSYDNNGNLATVTHFNGIVTTYTYDTLNRLLSRTTPGEAAVSFTYTATGKRHTMNDASGTTTYSYDAMDRLTQKATPEGALNYTYDAAGNRIGKKTVYFGSPHVDYTWYVRDAQGNVLNLYSASKDTTSSTSLADFNLVLQESMLYGSSRLGLQYLNTTAEPPSPRGQSTARCA